MALDAESGVYSMATIVEGKGGAFIRAEGHTQSAGGGRGMVGISRTRCRDEVALMVVARVFASAAKEVQ